MRPTSSVSSYSRSKTQPQQSERRGTLQISWQGLAQQSSALHSIRSYDRSSGAVRTAVDFASLSLGIICLGLFEVVSGHHHSMATPPAPSKKMMLSGMCELDAWNGVLVLPGRRALLHGNRGPVKLASCPGSVLLGSASAPPFPSRAGGSCIRMASQVSEPPPAVRVGVYSPFQSPRAMIRSPSSRFALRNAFYCPPCDSNCRTSILLAPTLLAMCS